MNYELLAAELTRDEGKRNRIYKDTVGKTTGGVGRNLDDVGLFDDEISLMLTNDMVRTWTALLRALPEVAKLDEVRQRVLANMAFNMGVEGLMAFKNTLSAVFGGNYAKAADGMLSSKWAQQVGARATRLANMMRTGAA